MQVHVDGLQHLTIIIIIITNISNFVLHLFRSRNYTLFVNQESSEELVSISKSIILFILLLPFAICSSQVYLLKHIIIINILSGAIFLL